MLETLTIQDKETAVFKRWDSGHPFAWAQVEFVKEVQRQYNAGKPVRIIVLKARQLGISTVTAMIFFLWCFMHRGTSGLIMAHETDTSEALFEKTQVFWEQWPFSDFYTLRHATQRKFVWNETRSSLRIATAKNLKSGRGRTLHVVHATEFSIWDDPVTLLLGLRQTIPQQHGTMLTIESTANGVGNMFHSTWEGAVAGENEFTAMFFPYWKHYEYRRPVSTLLYEPMDEEEKWLCRLMEEGDGFPPNMRLGLESRREVVEWRRWAIKDLANGDIDAFKQEYPATPEEAFLHTGRNVFPLERLRDVYVEKKGARGFLVERGGRFIFVEDATGPLIVYKWPGDKVFAKYFVGGDPTHTTTGDRACIQVINRRTLEQVAVWHGRIDPIGFARELTKLGYFYNEAMITTEIEGPGYATIGALVADGYPEIWHHHWADRAPGKPANTLGWSTNYNRKHQAVGLVISRIGDLARSIVQKQHPGFIHDPETYHQMRNYTVLDNGEMGPGDANEYDDAVMALAITHCCNMFEGPLPYDPPPPQAPDNQPPFVQP